MSSEDLTAEDAQEDEKDSLPTIRPNYVQDTGPLMILSLFLLLLAFFILLVTMSNIDNQKRVAVFNSVAAAFLIDRDQQRELNIRVNDLGNFQDEDFLDLQKELWLSLVSLAPVKQPITGNYMELSLHSNQVFEPRTSNLKVKADQLIRRVVSSMNNPAEGFRV